MEPWNSHSRNSSPRIKRKLRLRSRGSSGIINDMTSGGDAAAVCSEDRLQEEERVDSPGPCSLPSSSPISSSPVSSSPASPSPASSNSGSSSSMRNQRKKEKLKT
ncbi:hypothetical protein HPB50_013024 [Hyalomma asiaticum]|uniref:Uncharacterized protein n=1 Tax=Hyalomma asiaticum TaxID=266040 RepID=A0ACB7TK02_HYAAI|nr:hypothetical protein HPB50_013024 [Hyalomma asiaticum]